MTALIVGLFVSYLGIIGVTWWMDRRMTHVLEDMKTARTEAARALDAAVDGEAIDRQFGLIAKDLEQLELQISEEVANSERRENRIRGSVRRAREELAQVGVHHPGLDAEASQLQLLDGGGGGDEGVSPVHDVVGSPAESSVRGVTREQLLKARGMR